MLVGNGGGEAWGEEGGQHCSSQFQIIVPTQKVGNKMSKNKYFLFSDFYLAS